MIKNIEFKQYKLFRNWQKLDLKPITVIIGKNNSGKSAVVKLPTIIGGSLSGTFSAPVNWKNRIGSDSNNSVELGSSFQDLIYNRNITTSSLELKIEAQGASEGIESLCVKINNGEFLEYIHNGDDKVLEDHNFKGFLIDGKPFESIALNLDYISAFRVFPQQSYTKENEESDKIGIDGKNAYQILIKDFDDESVLVDKVAKWYQENFENWKLEIKKNNYDSLGVSYYVAISNNEINAINITNAGQGIHQALPLIVRSYMKDETTTLIIIEEPETHLHPAAHGNLAQRFAESYLEDRNKRYLIETHSQNFVLRLRRLVAEQKIDKDDLAIYYVDFDETKKESKMTQIEVDELGDVTWWPSGIFDESLEEAIEFRKAQEKR